MTEKVKLTGKANFTWIDISTPNIAELEALGNQYPIHPLALKDCMEPDHLPKFERLDNFDFIILRVHNNEKQDEAQTPQQLTNKIAIFYNDDVLVTVHRKQFPFLEAMKQQYGGSEKCTSSQGVVSRVIREAVHSFDKPAQQLSEEIDQIENVIFLKTIRPALLERFYFLKRQASLCKKLLLQTQEILAMHQPAPDDTELLQDIRDLHLKLVTLFDVAQEDVNNLSNIYLSLSAQKTNDVMKVLTVFSAFFMPLTFIAGIYGMNFENMPELKMRYGYFACLVFMAITVLGILVWFKRKKLI
ncbi:MAG: magnesium transporter CorA [Saprospiraceae bacterium]|nr:magnesium transporter CorA [Saprospiraceae bacterium]